MEYVNGGTLKTFIQKRKPLDKDTIRFIAAELLCAIQFLHSRDIAHGDIYTDHILCDSSGHVKIIDFGMPKILKHSTCEPESAKGLLFYVMEYVNGGTLKTFVQKRKPLDKDTIRLIAAELLCAIQFLHSRDIAHGDIYTDNILFDSSGHVKIIDFGMPKILKHSTCEPESAKDFHDRRNALQREFMFFLQCSFSDVRSQKKSQFSFVHIRRHPFFTGINWDELESGNISPPYVMEPSTEINRSKKINVKHSILKLRRRFDARRASISEVDGFDFFSERWKDMQQKSMMPDS